MSQPTVLYDAPGPRARRVTLIVSVMAIAVVLAGGYFLLYRPLDAKGQFDMALWAPLVDPGNQYFTQVWHRIGQGFRATLLAAAAAIVASLVIGTALAILRIQLKAQMRRRFVGMAAPVGYLLRGLTVALNGLTRFYVEVFRGIPVVITIVFVWIALPQYGVTFDNAIWYLVIGLTIYNSVVIGEILRSGMEGLPSGQREAADAVGLSPFQTIRMILLPQAYRIMLPALISQLVVVLKDTSLGFIISYEEVLRVSSQVVQFLNNPIQVYFVVGVIYILINYALSKLAQYTQRRLARGRRTAGIVAGIAAETPAFPTAAGTGIGVAANVPGGNLDGAPVPPTGRSR
jgi:glutamate transport system permease protein